MIVKAFELRDKATFIPVLAVAMVSSGEAEWYLLSRAGFRETFCVVLCRMECHGMDRNATYDAFAWGDRTFNVAHNYILENWDKLESGAVIDVQFILGETKEPKKSETVTDFMNETREQHLQWCKERAIRELDFYPDVREACRNAIASMGSDLRKHPETVDHVAISLGMALLLGDRLEARDLEACRKFILGFH